MTIGKAMIDMAKTVLIIGKSGSGKSRSILNLDPKSTFLINVNGKELPFKGWSKKYTPITKDGGNMYSCKNSPTDYGDIKTTLRFIDEKRPEIKTVVIDDTQYLMANEYMRRSKEKGFEKFTEIGEHLWSLIWDCQLCRQDMIIFFLSHSETSESGETKMKTIGKLLDEKVCIEGMFSIVLGTSVDDGKYFFNTQSDGKNTLKSPEGMFPKQIENDLQKVIQHINAY